MPYEPNAYRKPTAEELKSRQYTLFWVSLADNVLLVGLYLFGKPILGDADIAYVLVGLVSGSLLFSTLKGRTDSYYRELAAMGHRWALCGVAALLPVSFLALETDLLVPAREIFRDPYLSMLLLALLYHFGRAFAWLRDNLGSES